MLVLDTLRKQRNVIDYSGDLVSESMAEEALRQAEALLQQIAQWLEQQRPDLLPIREP